ncbi:SOSS complex subunit B family protein [Haloferax chudinovii]|uniref:SOSS complex subunit B family protein n=1 Tax=Haloferax chudinovii TaxID=1109010 RepID=A0ABD5XSK4_9EURY
MSSNNSSRKVVSVAEQAFEHANETAVDEDGFEVVDETPTFQVTVQQEIQAKVDANHPDGIADTSDERIQGVTLAQEERIQAREAELERISARAELGSQEGREARSRAITAERSAGRRRQFQKRVASVNPMADPDRADPRTELTQAQLGAVNSQATRLAEKLDGWSRAAISRRLSEVLSGKDMLSAAVSVFEGAPGTMVPIGKLEGMSRREVCIEGTLTTMWESESPAIQQVGLLEDETGQVKLTSWKASDVPWIREGERVRIHGAARNWYDGRVSVALTGWTTVHFPERDAWWDA